MPSSSELQEESGLIKAFRSLNLFTEEQLHAIAEASNNSKNFPIENWFNIKSVKVRALYFDCIKYFDDYLAWEKSGRTKVEPVLNNKNLAALSIVAGANAMASLSPSLPSEPVTETKQNESESLPKLIAVVLPSIPSKIPTPAKTLRTPQPVRKRSVLSKSSSSSSLFKQRQTKSSYSPLYIGKDILLEKEDPILDKIDKTTSKQLKRKPAISFPGYIRIDGSTSDSDALKSLKDMLDERGEKYRELGSGTNGISNSPTMTRP